MKYNKNAIKYSEFWNERNISYTLIHSFRISGFLDIEFSFLFYFSKKYWLQLVLTPFVFKVPFSVRIAACNKSTRFNFHTFSIFFDFFFILPPLLIFIQHVFHFLESYPLGCKVPISHHFVIRVITCKQ